MPARWCPPRAPPPSPTCLRCSDGVPAGITTLTPAEYRNPGELPDGGVLVVGASASGIQIAEELHRSGRPGHARRRGARPNAAHLSRQGHPVVDGRVGAARRALRRDPRPRPGSQPAVDAAGRLTRAQNRRPQRAARTRRATGRPAGRHPGRDGAILRLVGQHVRVGRPEARTAARHLRRMGGRSGCGRPSVRRNGSPPPRFPRPRR